jgi:hypothetical protein
MIISGPTPQVPRLVTPKFMPSVAAPILNNAYERGNCRWLGVAVLGKLQ